MDKQDDESLTILSSSASIQKSLEAIIKPSSDDRDFLKYIDQSKSVIISYITGYTIEFTNNIFDDFTKGSN